MVNVATNQERLNALFDKDSRNDSAIADALGVSKQSISAWRNGTRSPKASMIKKIADMYHVTLEWIMGWDDGAPAYDDDDIPYVASKEDVDRLEALHQNPELGMLFDRQRNMSKEDIDKMMKIVDAIFGERDTFAE